MGSAALAAHDRPARTRRPIVPLDFVVAQHADEAAHLRRVRSVLLRSPEARLFDIVRNDDRLAAHLDGLALAGPRVRTEAASIAAGQLFADTVAALGHHDPSALDELVERGLGEPGMAGPLASAFGWVPTSRLRGVVRDLLTSSAPPRRGLGLTVCRLHGADPGSVLAGALDDTDDSVRRGAYRLAGALGRVDLMTRCRDAVAVETGAGRGPAACAALLLGERCEAVLRAAAPTAASSTPVECLAILAGPADLVAMLVRELAQQGKEDPDVRRRVIRLCGLSGQIEYIPWLFDMMAEATTARAAGEAFALITGVDLAAAGLDRPRPADFTPAGEAPGANLIELDDDEGLPWPDADAARIWWQGTAVSLPTAGQLFMGAPAQAADFDHLLRSGRQRQRIVAALRAKLAQPSRALFNVCAPGWRQLEALKT